MAHHGEKHSEKSKTMGGRHSKGKHGMGKKEAGFGSKLGKHHGKAVSMEGPHK